MMMMMMTTKMTMPVTKMLRMMVMITMTTMMTIWPLKENPTTSTSIIFGTQQSLILESVKLPLLVFSVNSWLLRCSDVKVINTIFICRSGADDCPLSHHNLLHEVGSQVGKFRGEPLIFFLLTFIKLNYSQNSKQVSELWFLSTKPLRASQHHVL